MLRVTLVFAAIVLLLPWRAWATLGGFSVPATGGALCEAAIAYAQRGHGIPAGILGAIAKVESGRADAGTGVVAPWPWTIDVEGEGHFYPTEAAAIAAVRQFQQAGRRSIDIGCMQVNLVQHPEAFASLEQAFDPVTNAEYAAHLLARLRAGVAGWMDAVGLYHSATPALALPYRERVVAAMEGRASPLLDTPPPMLAAAMQPAPFGSVGGAMQHRIMQAPQPPQISRLAQGMVTGRGLSAYRLAPVFRHG
jgi:hypothetical protein